MNTILAASMISYGTPGAPNPTSVRQGAYQVPFTKTLSQNTAAVFPTELKPITSVKVSAQGSTDQFVVFSHYGPCPLVPDNNNTPGMTPYSTTQMRDDFNLPIAGAPAPGQKALMFQTAAGNPIALGTTSTSPDGVTSPQIPNSGDVTPGTTATNPATVASGPVTKQHPWITDVVTGHALEQFAYGKYDYTDPTGTVHASLGKGDKKVKKPLLNVKLSTNTTAPYLLSTAVAGLVPTQYPDSGMEFSLVGSGGNDGIKNRVKWGTGVDADNQIDLKIRTSATIPAVGAGDQTARAFPCYDGTVFNDSCIDYDPITGAAYVKRDGTTIGTNAVGELTNLGGGGGGGGTGSPVTFSTAGFLNTVAANITPGHHSSLAWGGGISVDHGGWVTAGTGATGPTIVFPVTGTYGISAAFDGEGSTGDHGEFQIDLTKNGSTTVQETEGYWDDTHRDDVTGATFKVADFVAGDTLTVDIYNSALSSGDFIVDGGSIDIWLIQSQPSTVAFSTAGFLGSGSILPGHNDTLTWAGSGISVDIGGWVTAGTGATGPTIVFPVTATYAISVCAAGDASTGDHGEFQIDLTKNGATTVHEESCVFDLTHGNEIVGSCLKVASFTAGDSLQIQIFNSGLSSGSISFDGGTIDIWKV